MTEYPRDPDDAIADLNEYAIDEHGDERCGWELCDDELQRRVEKRVWPDRFNVFEDYSGPEKSE